MDRKAGARFSQTSKDQIMQHVQAMKDLAAAHSDLIKQHKALMTKASTIADDLADVLGDSTYAYGDDQQQSQETSNTGKSRLGPSSTPNHQPGTLPTDEISIEDLEAFLASTVKK
jgi:hypothetical protein